MNIGTELFYRIWKVDVAVPHSRIPSSRDRSLYLVKKKRLQVPLNMKSYGNSTRHTAARIIDLGVHEFSTAVIPNKTDTFDMPTSSAISLFCPVPELCQGTRRPDQLLLALDHLS